MKLAAANLLASSLFFSSFVLLVQGKSLRNGRAQRSTENSYNNRIGSRRLDTSDIDSDVANDLMFNITEDDSYNEDWIDFDGSNYTYAYQAISTYLLPSTTDIRSEYADRLEYAIVWMASLNGMPSSVSDTAAANGCNTTCFDYVEAQLFKEITMLSNMNTWYDQYIKLQDEVSTGLLSGLTTAFGYMSMTDEVVTPPSSSDSSWISILLGTITEVADVAAQAAAPAAIVNALKLAAGTGSLVNDVLTAGSSSTSTNGINFDQNDMLDLSYAELYDYTKTTYDNLNSVAANQVNAIAMNYGKLLTFNEEVYADYSGASDEDIKIWVLDSDPYFDWTGFTWLFTSKYELCHAYDYGQKSPTCNNRGIPSELKTDVSSGTENFCCPSYGGDTSWGTCSIKEYTWFAEIGDCAAYPSTDMMDVYNNNTYAADTGLISSDGYIQDVLQTCRGQTAASNCTVANLTLGLHDHGKCGYYETECLGARCTCGSC